MSKIKVLSENVANMIAAGEVVERPSSAVKELVENSIDAGAKSIIVEIKQGGIAYIRVTDDGVGMDSEDAVNAFLRHATSKIQTEEDLEHIVTLGFRGEALASIAAVAKVELFTKMREAKTGISVYAEGGKIGEPQEAGCPNGTTIIVKELFYNTPARMKFLKKDSTEAAYIIDICQKIALSRPDISFRLINNGKEVFFTPGDNNLQSAIYSVLGRDFANNMILVDYKEGTIKISGYIGNSSLVRPNRNFEIFFVNGRCVVNKILYSTLLESYKNRIMTGKFPVCVLNIEIPPKLVDVNVHPAKTEIKFADEQSVYHCVYWACKNALYKSPEIPKAEFEKKSSFDYAAPNKEPVQERMNVKPKSFVRVTSSFNLPESGIPNISLKENSVKEEVSEASKLYGKQSEKLPGIDGHDRGAKDGEVGGVGSVYSSGGADYAGGASGVDVVDGFSGVDWGSVGGASEVDGVSDAKGVDGADVAGDIDNFAILGQVFDTYIIAERADEMLMIDQHAAHERIKFEELKTMLTKQSFVPQVLLTPVIVKMSPSEYETFKDRVEFFKSIGFEVDDFGVNTAIVRIVPANITFDSIEALVFDILEILSSNKRDVLVTLQEKALEMVACKSALKANKAMTEPELRELVRGVIKLIDKGINTCPHGRPICIKITKYQIEKMFKRVV